MPRPIFFLDSRLHVEARLRTADGSDGTLDCAVQEDRSVFACTFGGRPFLRFEDHCERGIYEYGGRTYHVRPWVFSSTYVGFLLYDAKSELVAAYDFDHTWRRPGYMRRGLPLSDRIAAEAVVHPLRVMWSADFGGRRHRVCGRQYLRRRYGFY